MNPSRLPVAIILFFSLSCRLSSAAYTSFEVTRGALSQDLVLSGTVIPLVSEKVVVRWYSMVKKMQVELGQKVKQGDLIAEMDVQYLNFSMDYYQAYYQQQENRLQQAIIDERFQKETLKRQRGLASIGIIGNGEKEKAELATLQAHLVVLQIENELRKTTRAMDQIKEQIEGINYRAPIDGIVTHLVVNPKQVVGSFLVQANEVLAQIERPGKYVVHTSTYDVPASKLASDLPARVFLWKSKKPLDGKIASIQQAVKKNGELRQIMFDVNITFDYDGELLPEGILATVQVPLEKYENAVLVPWNAIQTDASGKTMVQVLNENGTWLGREVTLGTRGHDRVEIKDGLNPGEKVRVKGWPS